MGITITDRRTVPEAERIPGKLAFKTAEAESGQLIALDEAEGIVTAIVSVTGTEDEVADIIEPGAYKSTLSRRRPKVCWAHSWERPIGRVLHIEELLPGDERLPTTTKDGQPWPREAGAVVATMQFNMRTVEGKDAFEAVRFYSETGECEYSIGYQVPPGKSSRDKAGVRHIKALELYELSVVLFGAHTMTGTISIKAAARMAHERKRLGGRGTVNPGGMVGTVSNDPDLDYSAFPGFQGKAVADGESDWDLTGDDEPSKNGAPDFSDGVMVAVYPDGEAASSIASQIAGPDNTIPREDLHVTLAYLGRIGEVQMSSDDIVKAVTDAAEGTDVLTGEIGGIGMFPADENADDEGGAPTWAPVDVPGLGLLREQVVAEIGDGVRGDHGFTPHMTLGYGIGLIDPIQPTPVTFSSVRVMYGNEQHDISLGIGGDSEDKSVQTKRKLTADQRRGKPTMPGSDTRLPIGDKVDLQAAVQAYGRMKPEDRNKAKRWIIRRARELGATSLLPDAWGVKSVEELDPGNTYGTQAEDPVYARLGADADAAADAANNPGFADDPDAEMDYVEDYLERFASTENQDPTDGQNPEDDEDDEDEGYDPGDADEGPLDDDELQEFIAALTHDLPGLIAQAKALTPGGRAGDDSPVGTPGGRQNWVDKSGGLPRYIRMVAHALIRHGHSKASAIATAVATMKRWSAGGGHVSPAVQAAAGEALAQWERMKGQAHAGHAVGAATGSKAAAYDPRLDDSKAMAYDPRLDRPATESKWGDVTAAPMVSGKSYPFLSGTYEERLAAIREAVTEALRGDLVDAGEQRYEWNYVDVRGTWADRVIATRVKWSGGSDESETYEMDYTITLDGVELGEPQQLDLQVVAVPLDTEDDDDTGDDTDGQDDDAGSGLLVGDTMPLAEDIARVINGFKVAHEASMQAKAGRVLSGANERQLRTAVENLLAVLDAAGVRILDPEKPEIQNTAGDPREEINPNVDLDTTSQSATLGSKALAGTIVMDRAAIDSDLARLFDGLGD